jgi:hypothetical protein
MDKFDIFTTDYPTKRYLSIGTTERTDTSTLGYLSYRLTDLQGRLGMIEVFSNFSESTGGYVKLLEEYDYFPVLIGNDGRPIPVFVLVEVMDGAVDYDNIKEQLPTLSYSQIHSAIDFLRKVSQLNLHGLDVDEIEDESEAQDLELINALESGLADKEIARVLYRHQ